MRPFTSRTARLSALILKMFLGLFFVVSAWAKLIDIDRFELYIYSFQLLSLHTSFLTARMVIVFELLVGIGLLSNIFNRWVNICTVTMLAAFTFFLGHALLIGRTDSCRCMGAWVDLNPAYSLLKNAVLLLLMIPVSRLQPWPWRPRWYIWMPVVSAIVVSVFVRSSPDNWLFRPDTESRHSHPLSAAVAPDGVLASLHLYQGRHAVLFLTPGCRYCHLADMKITAIQKRNHLDSTAFCYLLPGGSSSPVTLPGGAVSFSHPAVRLPDSLFIRLSGGIRPLLILLSDGRVSVVSHYRNIDEEQIVTFFRAK
ncbi:MAG: DoxX protein [bacterium P3]|nr:MAG: DoxX protein [bacterium P201]KWW30367.1 MAG: DoxX protein [bacterium P3]KWW32862.1 MAG: DoxX protein [bacterium F083]